MKRERVIFLSSKYPYTKKDWSGIPFFLYQALREVYEVEYVSLPSFNLLRRVGYYMNRLVGLFAKRKYAFDYGIVMAMLYGLAGSFRLKGRTGIKFIFSPAGLTETSFIKTDIPIVTYGDCSTLQLINYYPELRNVCALSSWEIRLVEKNAFKRTSLSVFSSTWACDFVKNEFNKSNVCIPFGSNLAYSMETRKPKSLEKGICNLLFIGVDWVRKGGDIVLRIHERLLQRGVQSRLTIVGTSIPAGHKFSDKVHVIPFLDKTQTEGETTLKLLLEEANFFILPTVADCTPVVIAESYSFGIPVLATNTGGIPSMVFESETGFLFDVGEVDGYVNRIQYLMSETSVYSQLSERCLQHHRNVFNWNAWAKSFSKVISQTLVVEKK